jgi:Ca2+:H+ antiporter
LLNWLLIFIPVSIVLHWWRPDLDTWIFVASALAIVPLAGWLGNATDQLARRTSEGVGGLLNATFGNAAELIIALFALEHGLYSVVKASLTGSIIGNMLLVLGASILAGGMRYPRQEFNAVGARSQATLLILAAAAMIVPGAFHSVVGPGGRMRESDLSLLISIVLLIAYALSLLFSLHTHKELFAGTAAEAARERERTAWPLRRSLVVLGVATALLAWMSEILVAAIQPAAAAFGMTGIFVGIIIVAIIGNAAEHTTAMMMAMRNRMELSMGIAIGSSIQIALFVTPLLVIASRFIGPHPMDLLFSLPEIVAVFLAVLITMQVAGDGESNWLEGVLLLALYLILALLFYYLPEPAP